MNNYWGIRKMKNFWLTKIIGMLFTAAAVTAAPVWADGHAGGTLKTFTDSYRTLNPAVQSGTGTGIPGSQIFAGLVLTDSEFQPQPYLAKEWKVSDDGLTVTFNLVEGATFHDGVPITSADVAFSLATVKANHPFGPAMFANVDAIETPNATTAVFKLSKPTPGLMLSLHPLLMPIIPKHILDDGQELKTHPRNMENVIGSGPFKVEVNEPGERLVLVKNDDFFLEGKPLLDEITFEAVVDPLSRVLKLENGELDFAPFSGISPRDAARLEAAEGVNVTGEGYGAIGFVIYLEMNLRDAPFNDLKVRRALSHTIDAEFIANVLFSGKSTVGTGPLHTDSAFYSSDVTRYEPDIEKAGVLLDEAGYPADSDGKRFDLILDVPSWGLGDHGPISQYLVPQLAKVGIKVELRRAPDFGSWASRISSFDYQATLNGSFNYPDPTIGVHRHFLCDNIRNVIWSNTQGYCDEGVDELLNQAAVELDLDKRKALYAKFQQKIADDVAKIYLPQSFTATVYRDNVVNVPTSGFGAISPWMDMSLK